ncbi:MAG: P-loop NTPase, partial [Planctomycetaceae bacterium]|nr:P-loop NTPase [Planctomycetaceae bacterium]
MSVTSVDQLRQQISQVTDPVFDRTLADLRMVEDVRGDGGSEITITIGLPIPAYNEEESLEARIRESAGTVVGNGQTVRVDFTRNVRGKDSGGRIGLNIHNIIAVGSGKGGVGKSTVAAALACGLHTLGCRVGLMDADVYGPSIPHMLGASGQPAAQELQEADGRKIMRMEPVDVDGLKLMSMGFFLEQGQSVVWRGPILHKA